LSCIYDGEEKEEQDYSKCMVHDITRDEPKNEDVWNYERRTSKYHDNSTNRYNVNNLLF
jgi:hypothetical protein